ncbi:Rieske (2Fe-2S) protein [Mucilaginibacter limnophilus]|uniref:Rieske (2Fe-2S) protein n=1 Tax=Mucilaginibacter limnophilus TaxID=1932778 RepID=A0A437MTC8_9SPHI|nr:Rieske (2Fe-2S) protein [Mucilaginibacter limnophilus]RVU00892.1 Rieske (2Fe-2S) protein [Mucilaginibacter limnophilus]
MQWYKVPDLNFTGQPFIRKEKIAGKQICLVGYEGEVFAMGSRCPHAGEDLSGGWCKDGKLVCPVHRYSYQLTTGRGSPGQNDYVETYPVKLKRNEVYVGIGSFWEKLKAMFTFEE